MINDSASKHRNMYEWVSTELLSAVHGHTWTPSVTNGTNASSNVIPFDCTMWSAPHCVMAVTTLVMTSPVCNEPCSDSRRHDRKLSAQPATVGIDGHAFNRSHTKGRHDARIGRDAPAGPDSNACHGGQDTLSRCGDQQTSTCKVIAHSVFISNAWEIGTHVER